MSNDNTEIQLGNANERALTPFEPTNIGEALILARAISSSGLVPDAYRNKPNDVLVTIMAGRELGLGPMQAINGMHVIKGKPTISSSLMVALCLRSSVCEFFQLVESTDDVATYTTKRVGAPQPSTMTYTMEQAKRAGLAGSATYKSHPAAMLRARCTGALARAVYPDLMHGVYTPVELAHLRDDDRGADEAPRRYAAKTDPVKVEVVEEQSEATGATGECLCYLEPYVSNDAYCPTCEEMQLQGSTL